MPKRLDPQWATEQMQKANLEPLVEYPGANTSWKCRCNFCKREVSPYYASIKQGQGGCVYCAGNKVDPDEAKIKMMAKNLEPLEEYPGANHKPWKCQCITCKKEVSPCYATIQQDGGGCGYCAGNKVDLEEAVSKMKAVGLEPLEKYPGNGVPWKCRCNICQREIQPTYNNIQQGKSSGCEYCASQKVDLQEAFIRMQMADLEPLEKYPGNGVPWKCRCNLCKREVSPCYTRIQQGQGGCGYCAGNKVDPDEAVAKMVEAGLVVLEEYPGCHTPWKCRCNTCKREVQPSYNRIQSGKGGCTYCTKDSGFKSSEPSMVYLIDNTNLGAIKIGIANIPTKRLQHHLRNKWSILNTIEVSGSLAQKIESKVLQWWRKELNIPYYLSEHQMPQGGFTETASIESLIKIGISIEDIWIKILSIHKEYESKQV